ncbi:hypothetical protein I0C86_24575 [Plantactinospora sp. S1510]|uniref:Uncharacterized protein n=1 Tax=Plantactinospora alkalitolerans TaxID=2789879 RepID=A0ABS0H0W2_9ACTN|nr:hypothetical protein [Plantactinospora alkalitolerans]MBF9132108.1 hypothetical protein [Plantactinospora alkalitolerans]
MTRLARVPPGAQREAPKRRSAEAPKRRSAEATARLVLGAGKPGKEIRHQLRRSRDTPQEPVVGVREPSAGPMSTAVEPSRVGSGFKVRDSDRRSLGRFALTFL